jgi:hypothetical protein
MDKAQLGDELLMVFKTISCLLALKSETYFLQRIRRNVGPLYFNGVIYCICLRDYWQPSGKCVIRSQRAADSHR